jgi:hypothetical protein
MEKSKFNRSIVMITILLFIGASLIQSVNASVTTATSEKNNSEIENQSKSIINVDFGLLIVRGNEPLPYEVTFIMIPINNPYINVGEGATIQINVSYELNAPGWHDDASCYIKILGTDNIATATTGETETGYLNLYLDLVPGDTFTVEFYGKYTWWYGSSLVGERYAFAYGAAAIINYPPEKPDTPIGPTTGIPGVRYTYSSQTTDPNGDQIYYMFDWDDGTYSDWFGPCLSGDTVSLSHVWENKGNYNVRVKAMDDYGAVSEWSDPNEVIMTKDKNIGKTFFIQLLKNRPYILQQLQNILIKI